MKGWIVVGAHRAELRRIGAERQKQKAGVPSERLYIPHTHFVGLCGEKAYSIVTGEPMNEKLLIGGDGGQDFEYFDVKTTRFLPDPELLVPVDTEDWPDVGFISAVLDEPNMRVKLLGMATNETVRTAPNPKRFREDGVVNFHLPVSGLTVVFDLDRDYEEQIDIMKTQIRGNQRITAQNSDVKVAGPHDHRCPECGVVWPCKNLSIVCPCPVDFPCKACRLAKMIGGTPPEPPAKKSQLDLLMSHIKDKKG